MENRGTAESGKKFEKHIRLTWALADLLTQRAIDEKRSENDIVIKALTMYLTKDVMDESLLIAKMSEIQCQLRSLNQKTDVKNKLDIEWYQYFFLFSPELPHDKKELAIRLDKADKDVQNFLLHFRNRVRQMKPMLEAIFGDMLEEDSSEGGL